MSTTPHDAPDRRIRRSVAISRRRTGAIGPSALAPVAPARTRLVGWLTSLPACAALMFVIALALRLIAITRSYDLFIDETSYARVAMNVAHGAGVTLYGRAFDIHPPSAFMIFGGVLWILGAHGGLEQAIFELRHVTAAFGALIPVALFVLLDRVTRRPIAFTAALVAAADPFAITFDSRVMLEAPAQAGVAGMCALIAVATCLGPGRARGWCVALAGVAGTMAITSKETFGMVVIAILAVLAITEWVLPRRHALTVLGITLAGYLIIVLSVATSTGLGAWWTAKYDDALRLVGVRQETGFNSPTVHVSLTSRIVAHLTDYGTTYVLLGLGALAAVGLVVRLRPWRTDADRTPRDRVTILIAVWAGVAAAYLVYATLFGSIEEQMYYILLAPAIAAATTWLSGRPAHRGTTWRSPLVACIVAVLAVNGVIWFQVHTRSDNEYQQMLAWESAHVPPDSVVAVTDYTSQFLIRHGVIGQWSTLPAIVAHHVQYVLVATTLTHQGYGLASEEFLATLNRRGRLMFRADGPSEGSLRLYEVSALTGAPTP